MNKKEQKKRLILQMMKDLPIVSTPQVSTFFKENGSPLKRASETLKELEKVKLVEGKRREIGKSKVWRLSSNGRSQMKVYKRPMPLNSMKIDHALAVADCWLDLVRTGKLNYFRYEPLDPFTSLDGKRRVYAPDSFFIYDGLAYLLEVQLSPLSTKRWAEKWAISSMFFDEGHYKKSVWQLSKGNILRPKIIVLTNQPETVVQGGSALDLLIGQNIREILGAN